MSYQVLARKYRPRIFDEIVGQQHVVRARITSYNVCYTKLLRIIGAVGISGDTADKDETAAVAGIQLSGLRADTGGA